jgi:hypothetical protein
LLSNQSKDIDLLIISHDFEGLSNRKRVEKVLLNFDDKFIDPICLSVSEYLRLLKQKSTFLNIILSNSKLIYEKKIN